MNADYIIKHTGLMFKADMILAYLDERKNQTRRTKGLSLVNEKPDDWELIFTPREPGTRFVSFSHKQKKSMVIHINMPYGGVGDQLYFKETWKMWEREEDGRDFLHYRADDAKVEPDDDWWNSIGWDFIKIKHYLNWQSSMFMPQLCSRFRNVPIANVRIERLQEITEKDAQFEGWNPLELDPFKTYDPASMDLARQWYIDLWDTINGKTLPWSKNPWVWVYEFPKYKS